MKPASSGCFSTGNSATALPQLNVIQHLISGCLQSRFVGVNATCGNQFQSCIRTIGDDICHKRRAFKSGLDFGLALIPARPDTRD